MRRPLSILTLPVLATSLAPAGTALAASGGPDGFGYQYVDQADGAVYAYVDITATGTSLGSGDDTLFPATNLGATFDFYGEAVTQVRASTNGFLTSTLGTSSNLANACPLPLAQVGGGFRLAVDHDDLISTVYYQYFDTAAAAAVGYLGEANGISVFQWVGEQYPLGGGDVVDVEIILFHDDGAILYMYASDADDADGATIGIQNAAATIALQYSCNVASITPGVTAILFTLGEAPPPPVPDSDCCTPSPTQTPGCLDATCQAALCDVDAYCCSTDWDDICADGAFVLCPLLCTHCGDGVVDAGEDCDDAGESATCDADCTLATCGDATVNATAGEACDDAGESATCDADCTAATCGDATVNATAGEACDDGGRSPACNADCTSAGCGDGVVNVTAGEACDDAGESKACNADCTAAACGDGVLNATAGEACDDAGESKACDDDCTEAACGDGVLNATAGEACDDGNGDEGDGCAPDCTVEPEPGTTGDGSTTDAPTSGEPTSGEPTTDGQDDTAGASGPELTTGPGPVTLDGPMDGSGGDATDTDDPGVVPGADGCGCTSPGTAPTQRGAAWSMLALVGLGVLRRRRRA